MRRLLAALVGALAGSGVAILFAMLMAESDGGSVALVILVPIGVAGSAGIGALIGALLARKF
ncbi:hypothetical protein [Paraburkholderia sp. J76]|uniref:hypothetical protein n=1 Tax=Paraburkholderia sp. J76 TaxID=2805439 RepID=UPI002ABDAFAF|nr:hypothetical protein [Paraburkholderia sp. J76]